MGPSFTSRLHRIVAELVLSVRGSVNQIVLRTPPGGAMMLASAIDSAGWGEVIGTLGGDDTVLVICEKAEVMPMVMQRFEDMRTANRITSGPRAFLPFSHQPRAQTRPGVERTHA